MQLSGIVVAAVGCTGQRHQHWRLTNWCPLVEGTPAVL